MCASSAVLTWLPDSLKECHAPFDPFASCVLNHTVAWMGGDERQVSSVDLFTDATHKLIVSFSEK
jgi:hypothetical protein